LSGDELRLDDELLDEGWFDEFSSIRHLIENNNLGLSLSDLIRGNFSLGSLLHDKGQVCMPDKRNLYPETDEPFFSGGFNLNRYGSSGGGEIDGIQIEIDLHTRTHENLRREVADDISMSLLEFLSIHYFPEMAEMAVYGQSVLDRYCGE